MGGSKDDILKPALSGSVGSGQSCHPELVSWGGSNRSNNLYERNITLTIAGGISQNYLDKSGRKETTFMK